MFANFVRRCGCAPSASSFRRLLTEPREPKQSDADVEIGEDIPLTSKAQDFANGECKTLQKRVTVRPEFMEDGIKAIVAKELKEEQRKKKELLYLSEDTYSFPLVWYNAYLKKNEAGDIEHIRSRSQTDLDRWCSSWVDTQTNSMVNAYCCNGNHSCCFSLVFISSLVLFVVVAFVQILIMVVIVKPTLENLEEIECNAREKFFMQFLSVSLIYTGLLHEVNSFIKLRLTSTIECSMYYMLLQIISFVWMFVILCNAVCSTIFVTAQSKGKLIILYTFTLKSVVTIDELIMTGIMHVTNASRHYQLAGLELSWRVKKDHEERVKLSLLAKFAPALVILATFAEAWSSKYFRSWFFLQNQPIRATANITVHAIHSGLSNFLDSADVLFDYSMSNMSEVFNISNMSSMSEFA